MSNQVNLEPWTPPTSGVQDFDVEYFTKSKVWISIHPDDIEGFFETAHDKEIWKAHLNTHGVTMAFRDRLILWAIVEDGCNFEAKEVLEVRVL